MLMCARRKPIALFVAIVMIVTTVMSSTVLTNVSAADRSVMSVTPQVITHLKFGLTADPTTGTLQYPATLPIDIEDKKVTVATTAANYAASPASQTNPFLTATGWDLGKYWEFIFQPMGYENLTLSFYPRSSNTGPRDFQLQYSTDNTTWFSVGEYSVNTTYTNQKTFTLPAEASNASQLSIRMVVNTDISVRAGTGSYSATELFNASTGVSNINNIVLSGTPITGTDPVVIAPVTSDIPTETVITPSTQITFDSPSIAVSGAAIMMSVNGNPDEVYTGPFTLLDYGADEDTNIEFTIVTYAECDGQKSAYSAFKYYTKEIHVPVDNGGDTTTASDPISADMVTSAGASTINDIYSASSGGTATVIGQVAYVFGNVNTSNTNVHNSVLLQDVIDGKIVGLQIYDPSNAGTKYTVGDIITVTGTVGDNGSVRQLATITAVNKIGSTTPFQPQELTLAQLQTGGDNYLSEYVLIKNATIGARATNGTTNVTDSTGASTIYKAATFPADVVEGSEVNLYAAWSKYNTTYQLRNGASTDYVALSSDGSTVDTSLVLSLANWAGTGEITQPIVYADKYTGNDFLNTNATLTHSSGNIPLIKNSSSTGGTTYSIGTSGSKAGSYYELTLSSELYGNIELSYSMRGSKTGPKNFDILYSTDGATWNNAGTRSISVDSTYEKFSVTLPSGANNAANLKIRLQVANDVSVSNGTISTGNNYFNNILITGSPLVSDNIVGYPDLTPDAGEARLGQEITITSKTPDATIYYSFDGQNYSVYDSTNKPVFASLPTTLSAYAVKSGLLNSVLVTYGYTQEQVDPVKASPNGGAKVLGSTVQLSCTTTGATIQYSMDNGVNWLSYNEDSKIKLDTLPVTIIAKAQLIGCKDSETSTFSFTQRLNENYNVYFGQIHSHTDYSDGAGSCDQAFNYAKNTAEQIDFLAVTDHSNSFDGEASSNLLDGSMSEEWQEGHALADQYTDSTFVGIYGFEMTWSNGLGHMNTFNTAGFQSRTQAAYSTYSTALQNYYATLKTDTGSISQFNHPGTTFGDFNDFAYYDEEIDNLISLIEVGNGEGAIGSSGYFPSYEYYTRALDKGWHVAPTNNQDNHKGYWGDANTARTVVLADSLTRENIYDALRNMRTYATEDNDLQIQYTLNNEIMGTIIDSVPDTVEINVQLKDATDSAIGKVEVIVNGGLSIASEDVTTNEKTVSFKLPVEYSYYYIRVTQADNNIAVTAPVWVGEVESVGVASIKTTEALPVKGEALDITTQFYNNEAEEAAINSIQYMVDDTMIHEINLETAGLTSLPSCSTKDYTFSYTYDGVGSVSINVIVNATLNGVSKVYKGVLKLSYTEPSLVTNVVIDGTHYNDYVTGYYGANMNNFTEIAAGESIKVTIVKDKLTKEILTNCDLLIISAPAKKNGTANAGAYSISHFEDSFLELVKEYTDRGGSLIACGIADYQDTADGQTTTEMNKLLGAIGATSRLNSDEAVEDSIDSQGKVTQVYRLYPTNYNADSEYTKGIVSGQKYSAYSGCTILLDEATVQAGKAEYLVKGSEGTYSINSKNYDSNYTPITKGNANILIKETLASGSNVFISGTVFISDFEVAVEMDNQFDLPYINRNIAVNILDSIKKEEVVSPIATVRAANKGDIFTVEGTVTAGTVTGNAFFDTIYIQDATGGINIFPINEGLIEVGQKVRVTGYLDEYLGDIELRVIQTEVIDNTINLREPTLMTTEQAMDYGKNGGMLVKVQGKVTKVIKKNDVVETIMIKDSSGKEARVFIDGYIKYSNSASAALEDIAVVGNTISAVGLVSYDPDEERLRVRDRSEIVLINKVISDDNDQTTSTKKNTTTETIDKIANTKTKTTVTTSMDAEYNTVVKTVKVISDLKTGQLLETVTQIITTQKNNLTKVTATITKDGTGKITEATALVDMNGVSTKTVEGTTEMVPDPFASALMEAAKLASKEVPLAVTIHMPSEVINNTIKAKTTKKSLIHITIPTNLLNDSNVSFNEIIIPSTVIRTAKSEQKDITVTIANETGKELYSWSFHGDTLMNSKKEISDINTVINVELLKDVEKVNNLVAGYMPKAQKGKGLVLNFNHSGILPDTAEVKIYVGDKGGMKPGSTVYVYYYNDNVTNAKDKTNARLEEGSRVTREIDKDGYLLIDIKHCSNYIVLPAKPEEKIVATLFEQVTVATKKSVKVGKTLNLAVTLPIDADTATAAYTSSDKTIAAISKSGKVTAKKAGKITIITKVKINGVTKTFKTIVTVK